jgi:hypothetical protein
VQDLFLTRWIRASHWTLGGIESRSCGRFLTPLRC